MMEALIFALLAPVALATNSQTPWLKYSSFYGMEPSKQVGIININLEGGLQSKLDTFAKYGIPSFYGDLPTGDNGIFIRNVGLAANWEAVLNDTVTKYIAPNYGPDKALRGVFFGDEICCHNATCWEVGLAPVATKLRALLGKEAVLYTNECAIKIPAIPKDLDLISVDIYDGFRKGQNGDEEVARAKARQTFWNCNCTAKAMDPHSRASALRFAGRVPNDIRRDERKPAGHARARHLRLLEHDREPHGPARVRVGRAGVQQAHGLFRMDEGG